MVNSFSFKGNKTNKQKKKENKNLLTDIMQNKKQ